MSEPYRANFGAAPQLRVPFSKLAVEHQALFHPSGSGPFVARQSSEVVNAIIVLWITIPLFVAMSAGLIVGQKPDASLGIMVVVVALFAFPSMRKFLRERARKKVMTTNPRWLGVAFDESAMVIRMSENACSVIPYRMLQRVHLHGIGTKNETIVGDVQFILEDSSSERMSHEESYDLEALLKELSRRSPSLVFTHDDALSERSRAVIPGAAPKKRSPVSPTDGEQRAGSSDSGQTSTHVPYPPTKQIPPIESRSEAELYLRELFAKNGVAVALTHAEVSSGQMWSPEEWSMSKPLEVSLAALEPIAEHLGQGLGGTGTLVTGALARGESRDEIRVFTSVVMQNGPDFVCR